MDTQEPIPNGLEPTPIDPVKHTKWNEISTQIDQITDGLGRPIDRDIRESVIAFNAFGFQTAQSCEGHSDRAAGNPWIDIKTPPIPELEAKTNKAYENAKKARLEKNPISDELFEIYHNFLDEERRPILEESRRMSELLEKFYKMHQSSYDARIIIKNVYKGASRIESTGGFLQDIAEPQIREQKLAEYQGEMKAFTQFLKSRFFSDPNPTSI